MSPELTEPRRTQVFRPGEGEPLVFGRIIAADGFEILELAGSEAPPPHVHHDHDKAFYVLQGKFDFVLGNDAVDDVILAKQRSGKADAAGVANTRDFKHDGFHL